MSSKSSKIMMNGLLTLFFSIISLLFSQSAKAQFAGAMYGNASLQGSGYYGGTQSCGFPQSIGKNAVNKTDDERDAENAIKTAQADLKSAKLEQKRAQSQLDLLRKKIERYFDSSVSEFLLDVHIEGMKMCSDYKAEDTTPTQPPRPPPAPAAASLNKGTVTEETVDSAGNPSSQSQSRQVASSQQRDSDPLDIPELLQGKWTRYCTAKTKSSAGSVSASICRDSSLREGSRRSSGSESDCARNLANYRKKRMDLGKASDKVEDLEAKLDDAKNNLADAKEQAKLDKELNKGNTEADCPDGTCGQAGRGNVFQNTNTASLIAGGAMMVGGALVSYMGNKTDNAAMEYCAQLGYPTTYCNSYQKYAGVPLFVSGATTMLNGGVGQGSFGCGTGASGGYYPYTMGGNTGGGGIFGPYGNGSVGGAFGYPLNMYGNPYGGGMYNPGMNAWGGFNGPNMMGGYGNGMFPGLGNGLGINAGIGMGIGTGYGTGYPYGAGGGMCSGFLGCGNGIGVGAGIYGGYGNSMGYPYGMGGNMYGGFPGMSGIGGMVGMYPGSMMGNPQYSMQMLQMQQQMAQQQMQYYNMQMQAQMQAYQRQQAIQQQAYSVQQEIASLQMRLQMIYSGAYSGGVSGGAVIGTSYPLSNGSYINSGYSTGVPGTLINSGSATIPGIGTGVSTGGR